MVENRHNSEVKRLIPEFKQMILYGKDDPETLKSAWRHYLDIKEKMWRSLPGNEAELNYVKRTIKIMDDGGLLKHTDESYAVCYGLRVDLGLFGTSGLLGNLREEEKKKVDTFICKMCDVLIRQDEAS